MNITENLLSICKIGLLILVTQCASAPQPGIQPDYLEFIPGKYAVLPCVADNQPGEELCHTFDQFVVDSFHNQPFLNGIGPDTIVRRLAQNPGFLVNGQELVSRAVITGCSNPGACYRNRIANQPQWRSWLTTLTESLGYPDATLIPIVHGLNEAQVDDRGLFTSMRSGNVSLLLVEVATGKLIWFQTRKHHVAAHRLWNDAPSNTFPKFPEWGSLTTGLFTSSLWQDLPGRRN